MLISFVLPPPPAPSLLPPFPHSFPPRFPFHHSPSSLCSRGCANYTWQVKKIYPQRGMIEDEEGGYRGFGIYVMLNYARTYKSEQS